MRIDEDQVLREVATILKRNYTGKPHQIYQPIEHPYFDDWDVVRRDTPERCRMIWQAFGTLDIPYPQTAVDIGCHTGYLCRFLSRREVITTGIDTSTRVLDAAILLDLLFGTMCHYEQTLSPTLQALQHVDLITCLSVTHRMVTKDKSLSQRRSIVDLYRDMVQRSKVLVCDLAGPGDTDIYDMLPDEWRSPSHFAGMMRWCGATSVTGLPPIKKDGRPIMIVHGRQETA